MPLPQLTDAEKGEIALKLVKLKLSKTEMPNPTHFRRDIGNTAKEIDVEPEKLMALYFDILPWVLGKMFGVESVSLTLGAEKK